MSNEIEITQNGAGVSEIAQPKSESVGLWCIYIAGPDDLVAMPTKAVAEAVARNFNAVWDRYGAERGHSVRAVAHAEPWMHGKAAHTKDLREHFHEYADLVLDEDAARFKPAKPAFYVRAHALERLNDEDKIWHGQYAVTLTLEPQDKDDVPLYRLPAVEPAQPVEAVDARATFEAWAAPKGYVMHVRDATWASRPGDYTSGDTQMMWEAWQAALAHPRPTGDVSALPEKWTARLWPVVFPTEAEYKAHTDAMDYCAADLRAALRSADMTAPTGEQAGEVVNDPYETGWADGYKQAETDGKLIALAQPRPTGDDVLHLARRVVSWMDSAGYSDGALPYDMGKDVRALRDALGDRGYTSSTVEQAGEVDAGLLKAAKSFVAAYIERYGRPVTGHGCFADVRQNAPMREEVGALNEAIYIATKAQPRPVGVPDGWKLVPVEPTYDMLIAGRNAHDEADLRATKEHHLGAMGMTLRANRASHTFSAMVNAAPAPAKAGGA